MPVYVDLIKGLIDKCSGKGMTWDGKRIVLDSSNLPLDIDWTIWQEALTRAAQFNQKGLCICGGGLGDSGELHHALITKQDARGSREKNRILHHSYNVILVHPECHATLQRKDCLRYLSIIYGETEVLTWYDELPFRALPRRI